MSRKKTQPKKNVVPDPKFNSTIIPKLINNIMYDGKRGIAAKIVYEAIDKISSSKSESRVHKLEQELSVIKQKEEKLNIIADESGAREIARRARGTPRIAGRLLRRVVDFVLVEGDGVLNKKIADHALTRLGVDNLGLDGADRKYLRLIADQYSGGPVGIETISAAISVSRDALEEVIEPYLLQMGLIQRTPRGRMLANNGWSHLGMQPPKSQGDIFQ